VGEPEEPRTSCIIVLHRGGHLPAAAEVADVQLDVGPLDPDERVRAVGLAPLEPPAQLVGIQVVRASGIPGQLGDRRQLAARHRVGLERQQDGVRHGMLPGSSDQAPATDRRTHG
jgi:hypothetical protein